MLKLKVPATSANLGPGFDCLGLALKLYNYFIFKENKQGLEIEIRKDGIQEKEIEIANTDNLIYKSVKRFQKVSGIEVKNLKIIEESKIPLAHGLGSSATAIVGTLYGLNKIYNFPLNKERLFEMAVSIEGHSDNVIPAFTGGFVVSVLKGNKLNYKKISVENSGLKVVLVIPDFQLETKDLRAVLPDQVDFRDALFNQSRSALLTSVFADKDWGNLATAMEDRLHQNYREKLIPGLKSVIKQSYEAGALGVALSGAGPTVLAFSKDDSETIGQKMKEKFLKNGVRSSYLVTEIDNKGVQNLLYRRDI